MGYQIVENGGVVILNGTIAVAVERNHIAESDREWLQTEFVPRFQTPFLVSQEALQERSAIEREVIAGLDEFTGSLKVEKHGSYPSSAMFNEEFIRFSAFARDFRVASDGSVRPGTYVTTELDRSMVPSGLSAVGRYALPNPMPAIYEYLVGSVPGAIILCGTCTPNFGQAGGGVEVFLQNGLGAGSATPIPRVIPER